MAKKETVQSNVMVIKLSSEHKVPQFLEIRNKDWIYFGKNNDYPEYLLTLFDRSGKHNAIISQKSFYIYGAGSNAGKKIKANGDGEMLDDIIRKVIIDYELFGGFALEVIWGKGGKNISEIRHVNFSHVRSNKENSEFYFTKTWFKKYFDENDNEYNYPVKDPRENDDFQEWPAFDQEKPKGAQLYYYKCYRPGVDIYPLPDYIGAISYIETDFQISNYWYNAVKNGFAASHLITFYGDPGTIEEQKELEKKIKKKFTGTDQGGKVILNFSSNKEKGGSEISNISPQDLDKQFQILNETILGEIFVGHRITSPMLFGIRTPGQLSGRNELIESNELLQNVYVAPKQQMFNTIFTKLSSFMNNKEPIELLKISPIGIDLVSNPNAWSMLDDDEKRMAIGLQPLTPEQKAQRQAQQDRKDAIATGQPPPPQGKYRKFDAMGKNLINVFKKYSGVPRKARLVASRIMHWEYTLDLKASEHGFSRQNFAALRQKQLAVLDLLNKDPLMPADRIAEAMMQNGMTISVEEVNNIIIFLKKKDLLEESKQKSGDSKIPVLTPVRDAVNILEKTPAPTASIFVTYSYEWLPGFSDEDADTSRDFCLELMDESKQREAEGRLWTRDDIELMDNDMGMSVWESRGGWYTKPGTDIHIPHCRHIWVQHLYTTD